MVGLGLDLGEILQQVTLIPPTSKHLGAVGLQNPYRGNRHVRLSSSRTLRPGGLGSRPIRITVIGEDPSFGTG